MLAQRLHAYDDCFGVLGRVVYRTLFLFVTYMYYSNYAQWLENVSGHKRRETYKPKIMFSRCWHFKMYGLLTYLWKPCLGFVHVFVEDELVGRPKTIDDNS